MSIAHKGKIHIVEDDDDVRASLRLLLEVAGFAVEDSADAESFLRKTEERRPDCLILDYHLSGMSGLDLLEKLRGRGVQTPAIIVTANHRPLAMRAARAGAAAVLRKPLAAENLSQWLDAILAGKQAPPPDAHR